MTSLLISKYAFSNPFRTKYIFLFVSIVVNLLSVNVFLYNYDSLVVYSPYLVDICVIVMVVANNVASTAEFNCDIAIMNKMCNKGNGGTHITIFASLMNASGIVSDLYSYRVVDNFGMFMPTFTGSILSVLVLILVIPILKILEKTKREDFYHPLEKQKVE
mmetsp:Transcript_24336/g.24241  ORF Transcript_24336/g.24241 Transcript_24336/m.24241 type:complete len:161 (-) Transcript_24336:15-497(-)